jgi:hypothetical protein
MKIILLFSLVIAPVFARCVADVRGEINVKACGAVGNFIADDTLAIQLAIDTAFGPATAPNGTANVYANKVLYFPPGRYKTTAPLQFTKLHGSKIVGAGRFVTAIENSSGPVVIVNGAGYTRWEGIRFTGGGSNHLLFDLNWDCTAGGAALQGNTFEDVIFDGGSIGIEIGRTCMGSENLFNNVHFTNFTTAGMMVSGYNALAQTIVGGNFQNCKKGIWVASGSVGSINGTGFQLSQDYDIYVSGAVNNTMVVNGARSESRNFMFTVQMAMLNGVFHTSTSGPGDFLKTDGNLSIVSASKSTQGRILARYWSRMKIQNTEFGRADWFYKDQLWWLPNNSMAGVVEIENVLAGNGTIDIRRRRITESAVVDYVVQ